MKKAKLMLSMLAVTAVLATTFAFKVTLSRHIIYTGPLGSGYCTTPVVGGQIGGTMTKVAASIAPTTINCPDEYFQQVDD